MNVALQFVFFSSIFFIDDVETEYFQEEVTYLDGGNTFVVDSKNLDTVEEMYMETGTVEIEGLIMILFNNLSKNILFKMRGFV